MVVTKMWLPYYGRGSTNLFVANVTRWGIVKSLIDRGLTINMNEPGFSLL